MCWKCFCVVARGECDMGSFTGVFEWRSAREMSSFVSLDNNDGEICKVFIPRYPRESLLRLPHMFHMRDICCAEREELKCGLRFLQETSAEVTGLSKGGILLLTTTIVVEFRWGGTA